MIEIDCFICNLMVFFKLSLRFLYREKYMHSQTIFFILNLLEDFIQRKIIELTIFNLI